jgi:uncharacterized caspase-like protein
MIKMRRNVLPLPAFLVAAVLFAGNALAERRVALVVGNANYLQGRIASSADDALLMADVLRSRGFELVEDKALLDLDKRSFERAIRLFTDSLPGADVGLIYYAGHALSRDGTNYLLPVGLGPASRLEIRDEAVDASALLDRMRSAGLRIKLMILDASRENPFGGSYGATNAGLARAEAPIDTIVSFAAQPGRVVSKSNGEHGLFTKALADAIRKPGSNAFDVFREVDEAVQRASGGLQRPWVMINSERAGRFSFDEPSGPPPAAVAAPPPPQTTPPVQSPATKRAVAPINGGLPVTKRAAPVDSSQPQTPRQPRQKTQAAISKSSSPAVAPKGRCHSVQAMCALAIGGCCDQVTGKWQYGRNGCGGTTLAYNNCISQKLAGKK